MALFPPERGDILPPDPYPPLEKYNAAHRDFVIAYTDVVPRNPQTGEYYFANREAEMRTGLWFIGGRMIPGETVQQSAARHLKKDTKLVIPADRFDKASQFDIADVLPAKADEPPHSRHASNTVLVVNLYPDEIATLNRRGSEGGFSSEISHGQWFDPNTDKSSLPGPVREFLRDHFQETVKMNTLHEMALEENARFDSDQRQ